MAFDYFYGQQSDQFAFYRIPKVLFSDERFWNVSTDAKALAKDYWDDKKSEFIDIVADSFLEEYDELNIEVAFKKAVSISATYALYSRCVDVPEVYFEQDDFLNIFEFNTRKTINALGTAVNSVAKEIFKEIERTVFEVEKSIESERSNSYDDRDELFESGRIFDSGHSASEQRSETSREVWEHEENIPQGTQTDDLRRYDSERDIVSAPLGSTGDSDESNRTVDERASGEESGTGQEDTADDVGAAHEQPKSTSRRNRTDGVGVQLTLDLFLSQDEQIKFIDEAENEVKTSFAFSFEQNETDLFLQLGSNTDNARMIVATEFMKQKSEEEIIATLKESICIHSITILKMKCKSLSKQRKMWKGSCQTKKKQKREKELLDKKWRDSLA